MKKRVSILLAVALVLSVGPVMATPVTAQNSIIDVPGDYPTIQAAIAAASDGDTIVVAAGLYKENVVIDKSLTLKGAQAGVDARTPRGNETIIEPDEGRGIEIVSAADRVVVVDGLTVRNARTAIAAPNPVGRDDVTDITVKNVRVLNCSKGGITMAYTQRATVEYCYAEDVEYGINAGALQPLDPTVATFRHNEIVNSEFGITGYLEDSLIQGNLVRNFGQGGVGISGQFLDTEIKNNTVTGYTKGAGITFEAHYGRELSENVKVEGNTFTGNSIGIYVFDTQTDLAGITVNFNNFIGNSRYGAWNNGRETLDATVNWWGDVSGPSSVGPGDGDAVSRKVLYSPWLGAELGTKPMIWGVDPTGLIQDAIDAAEPGDAIIAAKGEYKEALIIDKSLTLQPADGAEETTIIGSVSIDLDAEIVLFGGDDSGFTVDAGGGDFAIWFSIDNGSEITIRQNTLTGAVAGVTSRSGVLNDSTVNVEDNKIYNNDYGIYLESVAGDSAVFINFNGLAQNGDYGLCVQASAVTVEATYNWWGHASGPSGGVADPVSGRIADGTGTAVSENVRFDPWITAYLNAIEISGTSGGSVIIPGEGTFIYDAGTEVRLVALTDAFYRFDGWTGDIGTIANARSADTTITINGDYSITASFEFLLWCFIATAAYGTDTAEELDILREFRDTVLLRNTLGTGLVAFYYKTSPRLAELISRHEALRTVVRVGFVDPIVKILDRTRDLWSGKGS